MNYTYTIILVFIFLFTLIIPLKSQTIFFHESFNDENFNARGWYDLRPFILDTTDFVGNSGSSARFTFKQGATTPLAGGRVLITPSDEVYLSYQVKYSTNWVGSQKPYHPHEFNFTTNEDDKWVGPAYTHLTTYIEHNSGKPILAIQDGDNVDENNIGIDLRSISENRAVAGCNGSSDEYPAGDCYLNGAKHWNGKQWKASKKYFSDSIGPYYKNDWHFIEAYFKLNSIQNGKSIPDGIIRYWYDGELIIDAPNAALRTGVFPDMKFNQFLVLPYIGDGSPVEQTMWVDELTVASSRPETRVEENKNDYTKMEIFPNPIDETTVVRFYLNERSHVTLKIYDVLGNEVSVLYSGMMDKGENKLLMNTYLLVSGVYYLKSFINNNTISKLFVK
ncbi:MAG: T9SS type A sorting domain-containing protein [Bacteroidetes bacterium]|nr:MAG: T9SS type A sorting domain-containing protein [Bacteroidota bacterium]